MVSVVFPRLKTTLTSHLLRFRWTYSHICRCETLTMHTHTHTACLGTDSRCSTFPWLKSLLPKITVKFAGTQSNYFPASAQMLAVSLWSALNFIAIDDWLQATPPSPPPPPPPLAFLSAFSMHPSCTLIPPKSSFQVGDDFHRSYQHLFKKNTIRYRIHFLKLHFALGWTVCQSLSLHGL